MTAVKRYYMIRRDSLYILDFNKEYKINDLPLVTYLKESLPELNKDWVHEKEILESKISKKIIDKIIANLEKKDIRINAEIYFYSYESDIHSIKYQGLKKSNLEQSNILYINYKDFIQNKKLLLSPNNTSKIFIIRMGDTFVVSRSLESLENYKYKNTNENKNTNASLGIFIALNKAIELLNEDKDYFNYYVVDPVETPAVKPHLYLPSMGKKVKLSKNRPLNFNKNEDQDIIFRELNKFQSSNEIFKTSFVKFNQIPYNITKITADYQDNRLTLYGVGDSLITSYKEAFIKMIPYFMDQNFNNNRDSKHWVAVQGPKGLELAEGLLLLNYLTKNKRQNVTFLNLNLEYACELSGNTFFTRKYIFDLMNLHFNHLIFNIRNIKNSDIYCITVSDGERKVWEDGGNQLSVLIEKTLIFLFALKIQNNDEYTSYYHSLPLDQQYIMKYESKVDFNVSSSFNLDELKKYHKVQTNIDEWVYSKLLRNTGMNLFELSIKEV